MKITVFISIYLSILWKVFAGKYEYDYTIEIMKRAK